MSVAGMEVAKIYVHKYVVNFMVFTELFHFKILVS